MKDRLKLFILFTLLAVAIWVTGCIFLPAYLGEVEFWQSQVVTLFTVWAIAHIYGFVGLFFLGLYFRDKLQEKAV